MINNYKHSYHLFFVVASMLLASCSLTKRVGETELVYVNRSIELDESQVEDAKKLKRELKQILPEPTKRGFANIYTGFYNIFGQTGDKGFKHWVKYDLGKPPIVFKQEFLTTTEAKLKYFINGKGYFSHEVDCDNVPHGRTVDIACYVKPGEKYRIHDVVFPEDDLYQALKLRPNIERLLLSPDGNYDRNRLAFYRERLTNLANNQGYSDFGPENIFFYVDTAVGQNQCDLYLDILPPADSTNHTRYSLDRINIYPNYTLSSTDTTKLKQSTISDSLYVYEKEHYINHSLLDRLIVEKTEQWHNRINERRTVNRLLDLGLFRYVNINNKAEDYGKYGRIVQDILLTPFPMQSINGEFQVTNRSGNFFGSGITVSYNHKNLFGGAELLDVSISGQVEAQFGDELSFLNSSDVNVSASINFPRYITPFFKIEHQGDFIPRTIINTNYTFQRRIRYYTLNSLVGKYGFRWKPKSSRTHEFYPVNINQVIVSNKTAEFEDLLADDVRLSRSFDNNLIMGLQYYYTSNTSKGEKDRSYEYFRSEIETSGNFASLILGSNAELQRELLGVPFAQFSKLTLDHRWYRPLGKSDLAFRALGGIGLAYGNSAEIPYIKQYLIGGSNSLRAFRLRGLGPGNYVIDPNSINPFALQFIDQTGDMKIELNAELRFPLFNFVKGAFFVDAGNIWLLDNDERIEGNFTFSEFYKQIGIGTGIGIRLDFNFFLLRLDLAFPLRAPEFNEGFTWRISEIDPFDGNWRSQNLLYNLGIGYPF